MYEYQAQITRVIDGDTFEALVDLGFNTMIRQTFRVYGYDAPETFRPRNLEEKAHGRSATKRAKELLEGKLVKIITQKDKTGKYGRYLADIDLGQDTFAQLMITEGYQKKESY